MNWLYIGKLALAFLVAFALAYFLGTLYYSEQQQALQTALRASIVASGISTFFYWYRGGKGAEDMRR